MFESDMEVTDRLTKELEAMVPAAYGDGYKLSPAMPLRFDRRYSFVFRYWMNDPGGETRPLFVKIPHPSSMKTMDEAVGSDRLRAEIKHEFEVLQKIASVISNSGQPRLYAIKPGGWSSKLNAIFMEEIQLTMLKEYLQKWEILSGSQHGWLRFDALLGLSAQWLKIIHAAFHEERHSNLPALHMQDLLNDEFISLEGMLGSPLTVIRKLFLRLYEAGQTVQIPISSLHYDFHLGNIFVTSDERVGALDPNWKDLGAIYEDLASLLIDPMTRKFQVLSLGMYFRPSLKRRFESAVLRGYFGKSDAPRLLFFYCAFATLKKWRMNEELLRSPASKFLAFGGRIVSKYTSIYFAYLIMNYLNRELEIVNREPHTS